MELVISGYEESRLIQHGCEAALEVLPADMEAHQKAELNKKAHSAVILCLGNKVLREVTGDTTAAGVWSKLETLYMTKSLANKLYLKNKFYTFYIPAGRKIFEHIDEFNKIVLDLTSIEAQALLDWIMESGCSYHMTPRDNCVYSLDGHAMACEHNASVEEKDSLAQVWQKRLGHLSEAGLQVLEKQGLFGKKSLGKLEPRAVKCVLLEYLEGVNGYRLYRLDDESLKIVTSRNVVFNESVMFKDTLKDSDASDKSVEELQVEVELQMLNNHMLEEDRIDQEVGVDEDARDQKTDQPPDLIEYQLVRNKEPSTRTKPLRFQDESNMAFYAFVAAQEEDTHEPLTYQEAIACEDSSKWKVAIKEEMNSLRKNKTWELVDHPAGKS
nr:retrotransposon protein, putative, Ty1-copia subclass [Tanacetum cinerariifolium]